MERAEPRALLNQYTAIRRTQPHLVALSRPTVAPLFLRYGFPCTILFPLLFPFYHSMYPLFSCKEFTKLTRRLGVFGPHFY